MARVKDFSRKQESRDHEFLTWQETNTKLLFIKVRTSQKLNGRKTPNYP